jgi:hypothetical protein
MVTSAPPRLLRTADVGQPEALRLQRMQRRGELVRVRHGVYVAAAVWESLDDRQRHVLRIRAVLPHLPPGSFISHLSAAAIHRWPHIGGWPERVHVIDPAASRDRQRAGILLRRGRPVVSEPPRRAEGVRVTSPIDTAIALAKTLQFAEAVVVLDHVLRAGVLTKAELVEALPERPDWGSARAERAVDFADGRRESVGESFCAARLEEVGAPRPVLQHEFRYADGSVDRVDFWFPEQRIALEFDGRQKYTDPSMLRGRSPEDALWQEKRREDRIRRRSDVDGVGRTVWGDLLERDRFRALLRETGIPCR